MNNLVSLAYAATVAFSQALVTFVQVRADQQAIATMTDKQIQQLAQSSQKSPIGFKEKMTQ